MADALGPGMAMNSNSFWRENGKPFCNSIRLKVITLWQQSEEQKAKGNPGSTFQEISTGAGPCVRTCIDYVQRFLKTRNIDPSPGVPNPVIKLGEDETLYVHDLFMENGAYQLIDYKRRLYEDIGLDVSEAQLCVLMQKLRLSLKKPEVRRKERFENRDGKT